MKHKILEAYETIAYNYDNLIDHKPHNAYYDRPSTLALLGEVKDKDVLDAACGPGKYAEILLAQGARVTGFDLSPTMVQLAQKRNPEKGTFFIQDLSEPFIPIKTASFDKIVCALAMGYIENWDNTIQEFCRVLRPKGELVISTQHPFFDYQYYTSDQYFAVENVSCVWNGFGKPIEMHTYRRPLQEYIIPIVNNGFYIDQLTEPKPVEAFKILDAKHYEELNNFPSFMGIKAIKK